MQSIKHILVVVDPTSTVQHCVEKGAILARAFGAVLELFVCDYQSGVLLGNTLPKEVVHAVLKDRRAQLDQQLLAIAEPLRRTGLKVLTDYSFQEHLHAGVIRKVGLCGADIVVKDTHYHGVIQRTLFTNSDWHLIRECPVPLLLVKASAWHTPLRVAAALDPGHADDKPAELDQLLLQATERLAEAMGGEALAVHAFDLMPLMAGMSSVASGIGVEPVVDIELVSALRKYHDEQFRATLASRPAFASHSAMIEGSPVTELPAYAVRERVDLLVTGAVSRSPFRRLLVGSTAESLLDRLPCDILVVKPVQAPAQQPAGHH
jgi:universal stress protein E